MAETYGLSLTKLINISGGNFDFEWPDRFGHRFWILNLGEL
jgi:hypothetical protein